MTTELTIACDRLDVAIAADRLTRRRWTAEIDGRQLACLLAALVPACGAARSADVCPATVMPAWLAYLTPWIDDAGSAECWPSVVREYARLLRASAHLTTDAWQRLDYAVRALSVREARTHAAIPAVLMAIDSVLVLLDRAATGGAAVTDDGWVGELVTWAASHVDRKEDDIAPTTADEAAVATAEAAATASVSMTAALNTVDWAVMAAVCEAKNTGALTSECETAASDRLINRILTAWAAALTRMQAADAQP